MAATTIKTGVVYDSYFWVKWESGGQDVSANKTTINWSCGVMPGHKFYSNAVKMSAVTINGVQVYAGGTYSNITDYKEHTLASGTLEVSTIIRSPAARHRSRYARTPGLMGTRAA